MPLAREFGAIKRNGTADVVTCAAAELHADRRSMITTTNLDFMKGILLYRSRSDITFSETSE
jgi:hypothetical protein